VNNYKAFIPVDLYDLSPANVSFCEKKTLEYRNFL